jgi:hypothetical protein
MKFRSFLLLSLISLSGFFVYGQKIDSMMAVYADRYPQEKVYVQFDKNVYSPGETIWYKAYLLAGTDPSNISSNFYAEFSDAKGVIVQRRTAPISESASSGNYDIPVNFKGDHFHFRAYTNWMLNFDTAFLFEKDIKIIQTSRDSSVVPDRRADILQFFPEGGDLIAGLENNVAFKATDRYGTPVPVKGSIKDASGKVVLEFESAHDGMGKFLLIPEKNDVFSAVWKDSKGNELAVDLPQIRAEGLALRVINGGKKVIFSLARTAGSQINSALTVMAHMNQHLVYKANVKLQDILVSSGSIPVEQLPTGVLQITVFNSNLKPVAERVIFVNNHEYNFESSIEISKKTLTKRGYNSIQINVPDTLRSNLSVSITDFESDGKKIYDDNIISSFLLSSELKGRIFNPYYYFQDNADSTRQNLDLVMLTHGWRRFNWDMLAAGKTPNIKFPEKDHLAIQVDVLGLDPSRIPSGETMNVILRKKDSSVQILQVPKLPGAKFGLSGLIFFDTAKALYQFNNNKNIASQAAILFTNGLFNGYKYAKPIFVSDNSWSASDSGLLRRNRFVMEEIVKNKEFLNKKVQTLASVTVTGRPKTLQQKLDEEYTSGLFSGGDAYFFNVIGDPTAIGFVDVLTYLKGRVPGLTVQTDQTGGGYLTWRGSRTDLFLDEMQVTANTMRTMPMVNVAMIKVFRPGTISAIGGGAGGSVAVYSRKGKDKIVDPNIKGLDQATIVGYSPVKQFFSPDYSVKSDLDDISDVRTTLYWNPNVLLDKTNPNMTINFFNNDVTRKFRVVLEGMNEDGKITRVEKIIQ